MTTDIPALAAQCRYSDCIHGSKPGCAVQAAVERGGLSGTHLRNFQKPREESEFHDLSQHELRTEDRASGRFMHSY